NMSVEVRYVGTRGKDQWRVSSNGNNGNEISALNYNEVDIFENHFLDEFRLAQANLQANVALGRGNTFAYTGAGTSPLPTFLAFFNGQPSSQASNTGAYAGGDWTNPTNLNFLAVRHPKPVGFPHTNSTRLLGSAAFRANALAAGLPANYFVVNPNLLGGANVTTNIGQTRYNSMQFELKRRYAQGLQFQSSYVFGHGYILDWESFRVAP